MFWRECQSWVTMPGFSSATPVAGRWVLSNNLPKATLQSIWCHLAQLASTLCLPAEKPPPRCDEQPDLAVPLRLPSYQ